MPAGKRLIIKRIGLAAGAVLVALLLLLMLPPVQRSLVLAAAGRSENVQLELGYLQAGPWGVKLEDLSLVLPDANAQISAASADVNIAFWRSLLGGIVDIESAVVSQLDIETRLESSGADSGEAEQGGFVRAVREALRTTGFGPHVHLPGRLALHELDLSGGLTVVTARGLEIAGAWQLSGGGVASDSTGALRVSTEMRVIREGQELAAARVAIDADAQIDADSRVAALGLSLTAEPATGDRRLAAEFSATLGADETFALSISGRDAVLAEIAATVVPGSEAELTWNANLTQGLVAAFARGRSSADLSGGSAGTLHYDVTGASIAARSSTQLRGSGWDAYDTRLGAIGELTLSAEIDATATPERIAADLLEIAVVSEEHGELLLVRAEQPLRFELGEWLMDPETWGEPALRIQVADLPLSWFGAVTPAIDFRSGTLSGVLEFVRSEDRLTELRIAEPIRAHGVQLGPINDFVVPSFDISVEPRVTLANGALDAQIESLRLSAETGFELEFAGQATTSRTQWPALALQGELSARVPAVQRIVPRLGAIGAGVSGALDMDTLVLAIDDATIDAYSIDDVRLLAAEVAGRTPLRLQLPIFDADWNDFEPRIANVQLNRAPIEWVSSFVPELEFKGGEVSGRLTASGGVGRGLTLESQEPLRIEGFVPTFRGIAAASAWTASVRPRVELTTERSTIALEDLSVDSLRGNSVRADLLLESAGPGSIDTTLSVEADLGEFASRGGLRLGELHWHQRATLVTAAQRYEIDEFSFDLKDESGADILTLEALQPFSVSASPFQVAVADMTAAELPADIIRATIAPIRLEQILPNVFNLDLQGSLPEGEFFGRAEPDGALTFVASEPLVFRDVSVSWGEATLLDRVTTSIGYEVSYSGDGIQARSVELTATGPDGRTLLRSSTRVTAPMSDTRLLNRGEIDFEAFLAPLAEQPVLDDLPQLTSGTLTGSLNFIDEAQTSLSVVLQLRDATAVTIGDLADLDASLEAVAVRGERVSVTAPLRFESPEFGVSSLQLAGTYIANPDGVGELDAAVDGERLAADDLRRYAAFVLSVGGTAAAQAPGGAEAQGLAPLTDERLSAIARLRTERDAIPVWSDRLNARTRLNLDELTFSGFSVEDVRGALELTPSSATLSDVHASLFGADLLASARLGFDAGQATPYTLDFRADVGALELENVFLALSPDEPAMAEGHFELTSTLNSTGRNPLDLALSSRGRLHLTGGNGVFRGLERHAGTGATAARVIGVLTFSRELRAIGRMLDGLGEIRFEDAEFLLERNSMERLDLSSLAVRSPQLSLGVSGTLELAPLRPLLLSPLDADLSVAARGDAAILFDGMGLLEEAADASGYRSFTRPVHVGGTPVAPDASAFWELLEEAANNSRGLLGVGLRQLNRRLEERGE